MRPRTSGRCAPLGYILFWWVRPLCGPKIRGPSYSVCLPLRDNVSLVVEMGGITLMLDHNGFSRDVNQAIFRQSFENTPRHFPGTADHFAELLPVHPNLH